MTLLWTVTSTKPDKTTIEGIEPRTSVWNGLDQSAELIIQFSPTGLDRTWWDIHIFSGFWIGLDREIHNMHPIFMYVLSIEAVSHLKFDVWSSLSTLQLYTPPLSFPLAWIFYDALKSLPILSYGVNCNSFNLTSCMQFDFTLFQNCIESLVHIII